MIFKGALATSELIKCRECGLIFGEDDADVCCRCHQHICPKCGTCGCLVQREGLHLSPRFA